MNDDDRMATLDRALEALRERGLDPDSPGGAVALGHLLLQGQDPIPSGAPTSANSGVEGRPASGDDPMDRLSTWAGASPDQLGDIFLIEGDELDVGVPSSRLPRSKADRQRVLTLLLAAGERIGMRTESVPASAINRLADQYGVLDQNLPKNVATQSHLITRRGQRGSWQYRITQPGLERALDIVTRLVAGTDAVEI